MKDDTAVEKLDAFLRSLVSPMLAYPAQLEIHRTVMTQAVTFSIQASRSDTGRLIGERGGVFRGLRTLMIACGQRLGLRVHLLPIQEPEGVPDGPRNDAETWDTATLTRTVEGIACKVFRYPDSVKIAGIDHQTKGASTIAVTISPLESYNEVAEIAVALQEICGSIGKTHGIRCAIDVTSGPKTEEEKNTATKGTK